VRAEFSGELGTLEQHLENTGSIVIQGIRGAIVAIEDWDAGILDYVGDRHAEVRRLHALTQRDVERFLARQAPVACDLRLVLAVLQADRHLERMSHNCLRLGRLAAPTAEGVLPSDLRPLLTGSLVRAGEMTRTALDALALRDLERAESLPDLDELVDRDTAAVVVEVLDGGAARHGADPAARSLFAARCVERIADHAVNIAEQAAYVITGEHRELAGHGPEF
jgi:phosphate transport system protein